MKRGIVGAVPERLVVKRGGHDDELEVRPSHCNLLPRANKDDCCQSSLVGLVEGYARISVEIVEIHVVVLNIIVTCGDVGEGLADGAIG